MVLSLTMVHFVFSFLILCPSVVELVLKGNQLLALWMNPVMNCFWPCKVSEVYFNFECKYVLASQELGGGSMYSLSFSY